ncbi:WEB family protein At3g13190 [Impatiens glandulifera]|uniref:WEB family protein At3g13190 n=1 Tax=Impatiens glandulifera TaxID=253017 RepID=UPI001FB0FEEC|nr:WEB family protein At3g13190 [Impatiens glandulifera]
MGLKDEQAAIAEFSVSSSHQPKKKDKIIDWFMYKYMASSKVENGEIEAAVSLFGEGPFSRKKKKTPIRRNSSKPRSIQKLQVVEEDRVLQFPEKVINNNSIVNVKLQISNAEITKNRALEELAKAKRTVEELNHMIQSATSMTRESANKPRTEVGNACKEMFFSSFDQLYSERENALRETEEMRRKVEEFRIEVESSRRNLEETEKKLRISQKETEEAKKASEAMMTLNQLRIISESKPEITISMEEYEGLKRIQGMKVKADKEIEDMKIVTQEAMKRAERAEEEVQRWRQREKKKIAKLASRILEGKEDKPYSSVGKNLRGILGKKNKVVCKNIFL